MTAKRKEEGAPKGASSKASDEVKADEVKADEVVKAERNKKDRDRRTKEKKDKENKAKAEAEAAARRGHYVTQGKSLTSNRGPVSGAPIGVDVWKGDKVTPKHWSADVFKRLVSDGAVIEVK